MKNVISASRRTDLVASFPEWLAAALRAKRARVTGPSRKVYEVDLDPAEVHTVVLWSKNFANLLDNAFGLRDLLAAYDQIYCHFTITGLGGTAVEPGSPDPATALAQVPALVELAGAPRRVSLRFDPIVFWREGGRVASNLPFFPTLARAAASAGVEEIRISFAQWYRKAGRRAASRGFDFVDPPEAEKRERAKALVEEAREHGLALYACSQPFLTAVTGIRPSACIDGALLEALHPRREPVSETKDKTQRTDCLCTESRDIGSYTQTCPHGCVYCYANPE